MNRLRLAVLGSLLLVPFHASAQNELSILSSFNAQYSDISGLDADANRFGLTYNRYWTNNWSTEVGIFSSRERFTTFPDGFRGDISSAVRTVYPVTALVQYHFFDSRWRPYLGAGLAYADTPTNLGDETFVRRDDALRLLWNVGVTYQWTPRWGLRLDLKHSPLGIHGPAVFDGWTPTLGIKIRF
ncbi:MAG: OmpW family outer membrane protein [Thermoanaerobaculia bacterium]